MPTIYFVNNDFSLNDKSCILLLLSAVLWYKEKPAGTATKIGYNNDLTFKGTKCFTNVSANEVISAQPE